jgi:hypothetical protein
MKNTSIVAIFVALILFRLSSAQAETIASIQKKQGPSSITCEQKNFPNLPGKNQVTLTRAENGFYRISYESYATPRIKKGVICVFDGTEPLVFHCLASGGSWGMESKRAVEKSITADGVTETFEGFLIDAVKTPQGEPVLENQFRFRMGDCRVVGNS